MMRESDRVTWPTAPVGRLVRVVGGGTPSKARADFWNGAVPWVSPKDMGSRELHDAPDHITEAAVAESGTQIVPAGSVLIVVRSGILVHRFPISLARTAVALNQDLKALLPGGPLIPEFLAYALGANAEHVLQHCVKRGATVHSVDMGKLQQVRLPVPPPSEQRRIVEILDQADRLRRLRVEADAKAARILPTLVRRVLGPPSSWASDPASNPLGDLVDPVSGATPSKTITQYWSGDVPWVSPKDMKQDFLVDSQNHVSQAAVDKSNLAVIEPGNVLIVVRGMILARDVPVALNLSRVTINQDMKALVPKTTAVTGTFLWAVLRVATSELQALVGTAGHGTRKLDTPDLMAFPLVVPSTEQLALVESAVRQHRVLVERRRIISHKIARLFVILLGRAFEGSLTASWREDHMGELLQEMEHQAKAPAEVAR